MRTVTLFTLTMLGLGVMTAAESQTTASTSADSQTNAAVSADRSGADVSQQSRGSASVESEHASGALSEDTELNATLARRITTRNAKPGDEVVATLSEDVESNGTVVLEKGTRLAGRVTHAQRRSGATAEEHAESQLAIVFDRAIPKRGAEIPINATIYALAAAESTARNSTDFHSPFAGGTARAAGRAHSSGGIVGNAGGIGGAAGGIAGAAGAVGSDTSGLGRSARGALGTSARAAGALSSRSAGAVGGLDTLGRLESGSRGVFGIDDVSIVTQASSSASGSLITSTGRDVRLDSGTRLLLVATAAARR